LMIGVSDVFGYVEEVGIGRGRNDGGKGEV
jgi:hypothetical protein